METLGFGLTENLVRATRADLEQWRATGDPAMMYNILSMHLPVILAGLEQAFRQNAQFVAELSEAAEALSKEFEKHEEAEEPDARYDLPHVGGGYYELSNGERVQGAAAAQEAEAALHDE